MEKARVEAFDLKQELQGLQRDLSAMNRKLVMSTKEYQRAIHKLVGGSCSERGLLVLFLFLSLLRE